MILSAGQMHHCQTVHQLNVILMEIIAVLLMDGAGLDPLGVHVAAVLITEYKVNFEEKISKTNLCKHLINSLYICSEIAAASSYLSNTI
jgi:hypothetical protein